MRKRMYVVLDGRMCLIYNDLKCDKIMPSCGKTYIDN